MSLQVDCSKNWEPEHSNYYRHPRTPLPPNSEAVRTLKEDRKGRKRSLSGSSRPTGVAIIHGSTVASPNPSKEHPVTKSISRKFSKQKTCFFVKVDRQSCPTTRTRSPDCSICSGCKTWLLSPAGIPSLNDKKRNTQSGHRVARTMLLPSKNHGFCFNS